MSNDTIQQIENYAQTLTLLVFKVAQVMIFNRILYNLSQSYAWSITINVRFSGGRGGSGQLNPFGQVWSRPIGLIRKFVFSGLTIPLEVKNLVGVVQTPQLY